MKKYGLQLRAPPNHQRKIASKPPLHPMPSIFGEDDDDDVTKEISRQASKSRALQMINEQQKKVLEEDPTAFDYDGVFDEMKSNAACSQIEDQTKRQPKYIASIIENAKKREREHEVIYERKLLKERTKDDHLYEDKEKYVSISYKKKLAENAKWMEEERLRELRGEQDDVTKKSDMTDFYFSLNKNVAFGAQSVPAFKSTKEQSTSIAGKLEGSLLNTEAVPAFKPTKEQSTSVAGKIESSLSNTEAVTHSKQNTEQGNEDVKTDQATGREVVADKFKKGEDELTAARELYLARKRARTQL